MGRRALALAFLFALWTACATSMPVTQTNQSPEVIARTEASPSPEIPAKIQTIPAPEISGAVNIGGDRVMLIADEGYDVRIVSNAAATFKNGDPKDFASNMKPAIAGVTVREEKKRLNDIEDIAWDNKGQAAFVITSHSLNSAGEVKPARYKLARLVFKDGKIDISKPEVDVLKEALKKTFSFVAAAMTKPTTEGGDAGNFNIEGLAFDPTTGSLLIGLRSPTQKCSDKSCAVILRLKNPHELFKDQPAPPEFDAQLIALDPDKLGIRAMTYDDERKGFWIIAGRSDDPKKGSNPTPVASSLWFWDSTKPNERPRKAQTDSFGTLIPEGLCILDIDGKRGLLFTSDDGDETANTVSRYLWIPIPKLETP